MLKTIPRAAGAALALLAAAVAAGGLVAWAGADTRSEPQRDAGLIAGQAGQLSFRTVYKSPLGIEGLTGDSEGNLYVVGRGTPCPVWRVPASGGAAVVVGNITAPCGPTGLAFNAAGRLFAAADDKIYALTPSAESPQTATVFASGVPGANGVAFDSHGSLWVSDGVTSQGRVWRVAPDGVATEMFRVQPMSNDVNLVDGVGGVGRDVRGLPPGTVTVTPASRNAANTAGTQAIVANGLAFDGDTLFIADTARGAIWKVELDSQGNLRSPVGCDQTFAADTLCLDNVFVAHPYLEGADGIALDRAGNIWVAANERNAIAVVSRDRRVQELFRNPPDGTTRLRNTGPLEFPTSPFLSDRTFCVTQADGSRRDNAPNTAGEVGPGQAAVAKISCLEQQLAVPGLPLPIGEGRGRGR